MMKTDIGKHIKYSGLMIVLVLTAGNLTGQTSSRNNEAKLDADYYIMIGEYDRALDLYLDVLESEPDNASIKYKISICYLNSEDQKQEAIKYLEGAVQKVSEKYNPDSYKETNAPADAFFLLGSAYRIDNQLDKAIDAYTKYKEHIPSNDDYNNQLIEQYISNCKTAAVMEMSPVSLNATNLGSTINNEKSNFNPVVSGDGNAMAYTSPGSRQGYDIFYATQEDGVWSKPQNITSQLGGSGQFFKTTCLSYDGTTLFLTNEDPFDSDVFSSTYNRNRWSKASTLDKPINSKSMETHVCLSKDGQTLYFTSNRKGGEGDLDIYTATLDEKGKWGKPVNLGPNVNTLFNEDAPILSADGSTLYFSSEGHEGMGGYDIYRIDLTDPSATPVNLGYPINTTDNNYFYYPLENGESGYYAMKNADSYGSFDIYRIDFLPPPVTNVLVKGLIRSDISTDTIPPDNFYIYLQNTLSDEILSQEVTKEPAGQFNFEVPSGDYSIIISADGFTTYSDVIHIPEDYTETEMAVEAYLPYTHPSEEITTASVTDMESLASENTQVVEPLAQETPSNEEEPVTNLLDTPTTSTEQPVYMPYTEPVSSIETSTPVQTTTLFTQDVPANFEAKAFTLQFMALRKRVDLDYFTELDDVTVTYSSDNWYRYTYGFTTDLIQIENLKEKLAEKGYNNAFVLKKPVIPSYTIQVMAVPGPVIDMAVFKNLSAVTAYKGTDMYCRYTTGEFETMEEAEIALEQVKQLGYVDAFIRKW